MNSSTLPLVSVIMGAYNGENHVEWSLNSALCQEHPHMEIIVVDDGSTDHTKEIVSSLQQKDGRIKLIQNETNQWIAKTLNKWLANASGTYIANLDQDDYRIDKYKIRKQVSFLQAHPDISILWTNGIIKNNKEGYYYSNVPQTDEEIKKKVLWTCPFMHSSVMYRKDVYNAIGGYPTNITYCSDFAYRLEAGKMAKFANLPDYTLLYETNTQNTCYSHYIAQTKECLTLLFKYRNDYLHLFRWVQQTLFSALSTYLSKHYPIARGQIRKLFAKPNAIPLDTHIDILEGYHQHEGT